MAWSTPTSRASGYTVTHTVWNQDVVDNPIALRAGGLAISSQATGDVIIASSSTQLSRAAPSTAGTVLVSNGAGVAPSFQTVGATMYLLKAASGNTTAAGAETVDSIALGTLTALDTIIVKYTIASITQATSTIGLYKTTGPVLLNDVNDQAGLGAMAAGVVQLGSVEIRSYANNVTSIMSLNTARRSGNTAINTGQEYTLGSNWTDSFTLGLRHGGVTAGGTFHWRWAVYKLVGQ